MTSGALLTHRYMQKQLMIIDLIGEVIAGVTMGFQCLIPNPNP